MTNFDFFACFKTRKISSSLVKHKPSNSDFLLGGGDIVKTLKAIAPFLINPSRLDLLNFPIAGIKAKFIIALLEKCFFLRSLCMVVKFRRYISMIFPFSNHTHICGATDCIYQYKKKYFSA